MPKGNKGLINHISNSTAALIAMNDEILFNAKQISDQQASVFIQKPNLQQLAKIISYIHSQVQQFSRIKNQIPNLWQILIQVQACNEKDIATPVDVATTEATIV